MISCPGCGAGLRFDIASQAMKCDYCGKTCDPYDFDTMVSDAEKSATFKSYMYLCPQCGAELMTTDQTDVTSFCPYCGGASLLFDKISNKRRPEQIIPFQVTKEDCKKAYRRAASRAIFTPARYKKEELIDSFRGIYMPFWSYTVDQSGIAALPAKGTTRRSGDYLITKRYSLETDVETSYEGYAHDASRAFEDEISECIVPFDISGQKPFTPGFLSGFYADAADEDSSSYAKEAEKTCSLYTAERLLSEKEVKKAARSSRSAPDKAPQVSIPSHVHAHRVFYPVWFMSYRDGDRITYATVNGQNGKVVADFPISPLRFMAGVLFSSAVLFFLLNSLLTLKPGAALITTTLLLILGVIMAVLRYRKLLLKRNAPDHAERMVRLKHFQLALGVLSVVCVIAAASIVIFDPVYNLAFYVPCLIEAVLLFLMIYKTFGAQLELARRRPPQFNKEGGNDRA
ncbi:MAG: hypothetical protein K6C06_05380 [Lachnospiraceae bacterium]|nr:hypothetical protein [Lachnospiraceae bacterium]